MPVFLGSSLLSSHSSYGAHRAPSILLYCFVSYVGVVSMFETVQKYLNKFRSDSDGKIKGAVIQAEDELSAIGIAIGANWNGARAFTTTSGPGISLMSEFLGLAYFAEIPLVVFNIQRGGPSTGMPTRTQQSDIISSAFASHGDTKHILLFPGDPISIF